MPLIHHEKTARLAELLAAATRWLTFIAGVCTMVLGFWSVCEKHVSLEVDDTGFTNDVNKYTWRIALFSFTPHVFVDVWTPMVMGLLTTIIHFPSFHIDILSQNFWRMFLWLFITAMFGNLGYVGGIGIIVGSITLLADLFCLITAFFHEGPACLELTLASNFSSAAKNQESKMTATSEV
eukprot:GHVS01010117.1.p1 GENE.GHVS01010117.1~~GHVS01010117.1.p1  ORF type:complete len:180 (-),score=30.30 GHVS01010117.1:242-781(-)